MEPKEYTQEELAEQIGRWAPLGCLCFVKWTCEKCGERVTCDTPNAIFTEGYEHTEKNDGSNCGHTTYPEKFGLVIMKEFR